MEHNRQHARFDFETEVELIIDGNNQPGRTINISQGGIFIDTTLHYPIGTKITLRITIPGVSDKSEIPCILRWTKESVGIGLQFEQLRAIEVWALNKLVHSGDKK